MNKYIIYKITCDINSKIYIGYTSNLKKRIHSHQDFAKRGGGHRLHNAIRRYGWESFSVEVVDSTPYKVHALRHLEPFYIKFYSSTDPDIGYNITPGGEGANKGSGLSDEHKRKIGDANRGRTHSPEANLKNSIAHRGLKKSNDSLLKLSRSLKNSEAHKRHLNRLHEINKGSKRSEDTKRRMSQSIKFSPKAILAREKLKIASTGKVLSPETKQKVSSGLKRYFSENTHWKKGKKKVEGVWQ